MEKPHVSTKSVVIILTDLTKKGIDWKWDRNKVAFDTLKSQLTSAPILQEVDMRKPFVLRIDASAFAITAALLQGEGTVERPVEYASRLLTSAKPN